MRDKAKKMMNLMMIKPTRLLKQIMSMIIMIVMIANTKREELILHVRKGTKLQFSKDK